MGGNRFCAWEFDSDIEDMEKEITRLTSILARVHNELHDPTGELWCDNPVKDRSLITWLINFVDKEMDWLIEGPNA